MGNYAEAYAAAQHWKSVLPAGDAGAAESKRCLGMYQVVMEQAKGQDANQRHGSERPTPSLIRARG